MRLKALIPLLAFLVLVAFLGIGLTLNPREIPSALINKPVPDFKATRLDDHNLQFTPAQMRSQVWMLNIWASWCVGCREEHATLVNIAKSNIVPIIGLNYKEVRGIDLVAARNLSLAQETEVAVEKAYAWLNGFGDPYKFSVLDVEGNIGIDLGVYGVPETFIIDKNGYIQYKHMGPITPNIFQTKLLPKINELLSAN